VTITSATFFTLAAFAGSSLVRGTAIKVLLTQDGQGNLQMPDKLTPSYWWKSAKEVRTLAEQMFDPRVRDTLLRSAQDYEMLAKRAEERWTYLEQQQAILNKTAPLRDLKPAERSSPANNTHRPLTRLHQAVRE